MSGFDWTPYLVGGAQARPDSITQLDPAFQQSLASMFGAVPEDVRPHLRVTSGFRSPEVQQRLWDEALTKYGSEAAARKWVAPPGRSQHNHGSAVDLKYLNPVAQKWVHDNAAQFGLNFPMAHEPWHIEPTGARGGAAPAAPGGAGGLSYGAAQPNTPAMPSAISLADMFAQPNDGPAAMLPGPEPLQQATPARSRPAPEVELARRQALFADVGSFFG